MYRALIVLAALVGFGVGLSWRSSSVIEETASPACDGVCFDRWDEVLWVSGGTGVVGVVVFGVGVRHVLWRHFAKPS